MRAIWASIHGEAQTLLPTVTCRKINAWGYELSEIEQSVIKSLSDGE